MKGLILSAKLHLRWDLWNLKNRYSVLDNVRKIAHILKAGS